jgi:hypothetical protein
VSVTLLAYDGPASELNVRPGLGFKRGEVRAFPPDQAARLLRDCAELRQVVRVTDRIRELLDAPSLAWNAREKICVDLPADLVARLRAYAKRERLTFQVVVRALLEDSLPSLGHIGDDGR